MPDKKANKIRAVTGEQPAADPQKLNAEAAECLARMLQEFGSTLDVDEVLQNVADACKRNIGYDTFAVLLLDDLGQQLKFRFAVGFSDEVIKNWSFGLGQGIVGTVAETRKTLRVDDVRQEPRYITAVSEMRSELAIPLLVNKRTVGVLDVGSLEPNHFNDSHQQLLSFVADHLASGIENARLYESVRDQATMLSLLHEISRELTSILDREKLLRKIAALIKRLIDYQLFTVMLWNEETQLLDHVFSLRFDERFAQKTGFPLGHGVTGNAAALRQPIRVPNVHLNPHYMNCGHQVDVRSELAVPLVFKDRLIGVVDLESVEYNAFTQQHEQMLSTLASYIAVALENSRLYEKVIANEEQLEYDLKTAREIQGGLLPDEVPEVPGAEIAFAYETARQLGGDFFDFLPYDAHRLAIAVGDAAGKGTAAALHGSLAVGIMRGHVVEHPCEPTTMMAEMNHHLGETGIDNRFVAMVFGIFDSRDKSLTLANAGFTRPMLVRDGKVEEINVEGIPLGLFPDVRYEEKRLQLQSGDVVVFTSDGVNESMDKSCEEFGTRRLQSRLLDLHQRSAQEIADELLRSTRFHHEDCGDEDDRTAVVLKVL